MIELSFPRKQIFNWLLFSYISTLNSICATFVAVLHIYKGLEMKCQYICFVLHLKTYRNVVIICLPEL